MLQKIFKFDQFEDFSRLMLTISGVLLIIFLILHLASLTLIFVDADFFEKYSDWLHSSHLFHYFEISLLSVSTIHIFLTLRKIILNRKLGNNIRLISKRNDFLGSISARLQPICGLIILFFIIIHLSQLRFPHPISGKEIYTIKETLEKPMVYLLYILSGLALSLHLYHGGESSFRSLGLLNKKNKILIRFITRRFGIILGLGFSIIAAFLSISFRLI